MSLQRASESVFLVTSTTNLIPEMMRRRLVTSMSMLGILESSSSYHISEATQPVSKIMPLYWCIAGHAKVSRRQLMAEAEMIATQTEIAQRR